MKDKKNHKKKKKESRENEPSFFIRMGNLISNIIRFVTYDMWRITGNEVTGIKHFGINSAKALSISIRSFIDEDLQVKASALTYNTLLAIVPLLAVLLGIANGFGFQDTVKTVLIGYFPGQTQALEQAFGFVDRYLMQAQGGLIIGIGLILLFYTVIGLISNIEMTFNDIWQQKKSRSFARKMTDYLALFLILPILMVASSGMSIFVSTIQNTILDEFVFLTPIVNMIFKIAPFIITSLVFTGLYIFLPNTKVKFLPGLIAGVIAGCAFQFFQLFYISGQIWVTKYNAIYGSFAAIPLLLLWVQLSWVICLFGGALAYAIQNVKNYNFESDSKNITRRYRDFVTITIMSLIIKRFIKGAKPYTANELSEKYHIPIRLATIILYQLTELHILTEVPDEKDEWTIYYQPAIDINQISVAYLLQRIDEKGSENFKIDKNDRFHAEWESIIDSRNEMYNNKSHILIKDL